MISKKLIVNADDFGLTTGVMDGILKAHKDGIVTSTTFLVNSGHFDEAVKKLKLVPTLDLGLHLNITWGKPVAEPSQIKTLIGTDGLFIRRRDFEGVDPAQVRLEWKAQIKKARSAGLPLTHLDTHHHVHLNPAFLDVLAEIAAEEKLAVRSQQSWVRDFLRSNGIRTPDNFIEDFYGEGKTSREHLENLLRLVREETAEVCCHPALVDESLRKTSSYHAPRGEELLTLIDPGWRKWLSENQFVLSTFAELPFSTKLLDKSCDV